MFTKTVTINVRIVISHVTKQPSHCEFDGKSMEIEATT